jgi:hypothetical protein
MAAVFYRALSRLAESKEITMKSVLADKACPKDVR